MTSKQSNLSTKFNNLKKDYENLQTELSNSKRFSSMNNTSSKSPFQTQISYLQTKNINKEYKTSSQVLQEFRDIINRTSQITNQAQSRNQSIIAQSQSQNQMIYQNKKDKLLQEKDKIINVNLDESNSSDSLNIDNNINLNNDILNISHSTNDLNDDDILNIDGINTKPYNNNHSYNQSHNTTTEANEIDKLKLSNQILSRSNIDLRNSNKILELELNSYLTNPLYNKNNITSQYDDNLLKFIQNLKSSLIESIQSNYQLQEVINTFQSSNNSLSNDNISLRKSYMTMRNEIDCTHRKNAEIQIANEDNAILLNNLHQTNQKYKEDLITIQNHLEELKNEEMNMHLLHDSNIKRKKDNDELVLQLKGTIENLYKGNDASWKRKENSELAIEDSSRSINERMMIIQELTEETMMKEKENEIIEKDIEMKKRQLEEKNAIIIEINKKYDEVGKEMGIIEQDNEELKIVANEKEEIIKETKRRIDEITKKITANAEINIINETKEDELEEMIANEKKRNGNKDKEIEEITKTYEQILLKKNQMIEMYEDMLKETKNDNNKQLKNNLINQNDSLRNQNEILENDI